MVQRQFILIVINEFVQWGYNIIIKNQNSNFFSYYFELFVF